MMWFTLFNGVSVQHSEFVCLFDDGNVCVGVFRASKICCESLKLGLQLPFKVSDLPPLVVLYTFVLNFYSIFSGQGD